MYLETDTRRWVLTDTLRTSMQPHNACLGRENSSFVPPYSYSLAPQNEPTRNSFFGKRHGNFKIFADNICKVEAKPTARAPDQDLRPGYFQPYLFYDTDIYYILLT